MNNLSTFQIVLLAVFGLAALVGIFVFANFGGGGGSGGNQRAGAVTIWGTLPRTAIQAGLQNLTAASDRFSDVRYVEKQADTFDRDLSDALASGSGPDLIIYSQEELLANEAKLQVIPYTTLPERTFIDSYLPIYELFLNAEGTYGVPFVVDPMVLYYNRGILTSAGAISAPRTWEAVSGLSQAITVRSGSTLTRSVIALGEYSNVRNARSIISLLLLQAGSTISEKTEQGVRSTLAAGPTSGSFGSSPAVSAMSFYTQFADPAKTVYSWNRAMPDSRQAFLAGDVALYPGYASERPFLAGANPNLDFDMTSIPQPGTLGSRATYGTAYAFGIPKVSKNPAGALTTAFALGSGEPMTLIAEALSMAPGNRSLLIPDVSDRYTSVFYPEALVAKAWLSPAPSVTDSIFSAMIGDITTGREDVAGALQGAGSSLDAALR